MLQLHFAGGGTAAFRGFVREAARIGRERNAKALFRLCNDTSVRSVTDEAAEIVRGEMPDAAYIGCSTSGNICDGALVEGALPNLSASCSLFEDPSTIVEVLQFPFSRENRRHIVEWLLRLLDERPWVKAVEVMTTLIDVGMAEFCAEVSAMRKDILVFGGGALTSEDMNMWAGLPYVFSSAGQADGGSTVLVLYGGDSFHACAQAVYGWKPLGPQLNITRAEGPVLYELDGIPAFERYRHFLSIENDERFGENSIIFPLAIQREGRMVIKAPMNVGPDGSITLTSDLAPYHKLCRITYGDPATILQSIKECANAMQAFAPQGILTFSCAARRMYWGDESISRETLPFQGIAPTFGFYTGGEFSREGGRVLHHNVTLVVAGMREGDAPAAVEASVNVDEVEFSRQMAIVNSLAAFVGITSAELEDALAKMEVMAKTDGLTGVSNRREIEGLIERAIEAGNEPDSSALPCVIMFDIDDFKRVNDAYGHKAGDDVLKRIGQLLKAAVDDAGTGSSGRWGGEEFMVLVPDSDIGQALTLAENLRTAFSDVDFPASGRHTISVGVAQALPGETADLLCQRVDKALYAAKKQGKNCVVSA